MIINHNISALNTFNKLSSNTKAAQSALEKLSSGLRINKAGDDAAGLAISEKMKAQVNGLDQASSNAQNGISLIQTAEGALSETQSILQRMNDLAVQATNDTNTDQDRTAIQSEVNQLTQEIDRIANTTQFNTKNLLNGGVGINTSITGTDKAKVSVIGGTADTTAGTTVAITGSTLATAAKTTTTAALAATPSTALSNGGSLTLNGHSFTFTTSDTAQGVVDKINAAKLGVTASLDGSNKLVLTSSAVGSGATITAAGTVDLAGVAGSTGTDATLTITGTPAYEAKGNTVTMLSGGAKGLQFTLSAQVTAATISVDSNNGLSLQIGANESQTMYVQVSDMRAAALGVDNIDLTTSTSAGQAITTITNAINTVSTQRATLGAYQNRLEHTINNLTTESENLQSAQSQITDVDMSKEMTEYTKNNILIQSATSMLAQANQLPNNVLSLLKG